MSERAGAVRDGGREDVRDGERKARRASEESEEKLEKLEKEGDVDRCWSRVEEAVLWALARVLVAVAGAWSACCWGAGDAPPKRWRRMSIPQTCTRMRVKLRHRADPAAQPPRQ